MFWLNNCYWYSCHNIALVGTPLQRFHDLQTYSDLSPSFLVSCSLGSPCKGDHWSRRANWMCLICSILNCRIVSVNVRRLGMDCHGQLSTCVLLKKWQNLHLIFLPLLLCSPVSVGTPTFLGLLGNLMSVWCATKSCVHLDLLPGVPVHQGIGAMEWYISGGADVCIWLLMWRCGERKWAPWPKPCTGKLSGWKKNAGTSNFWNFCE